MKPYLMGTECEYAVSGRNGSEPVPAEEVYTLLNEALRHERLFLPDVNGGRAIYLQHGGRFYLDSGGHPEYASPEVSTPAEVAAYDKAGERLLEVARARIARERPHYQITIAKNNISSLFPDRAVWGCHESHLSWQPLERVGPQLIPHLVSRMIYAGAGCLSARRGGMGFELSQRARHLCQVTGTETTSNRPIFCTRIRKAADFSRQGWVRVHLITKDSQRSPFGIYLTFGTTGLLMQMINAGIPVGQGLALADPVAAVQAISLDPLLDTRVSLADGRKLTALEIQESYLAECERALPHGDFPEWAGTVLRHWGATLATLRRDPLLMARRLDPYCKLLIFDHELQRAGYTWSDLHKALAILEGLRGRFIEDVIRAVLSEDASKLPADVAPLYPEAVKAAKADRPGVLDRLRFAIRLQALELKYHELGGLYDQLAAAGKVESVVVRPEEIERASQEPPPGGRAAIRGSCVRELREEGWVCDWRYLFHSPTATFVDLRNPFETERKVLQRDRFAADDRADAELLDTFQRLMRR
jgi:hypothetical protein